MVTMVVATTIDPASIGPASALLSMPGWHPGPPLQGIPSFVNGEVRLIKHDNSIVKEDDLDKRWEEATGEAVHEVIFLSKHVAVSTHLALTVHPIGVPHLRDNEIPPAGGKPRLSGPPNPRIGPWFRLLKKIAESQNLTPEFEVGKRLRSLTKHPREKIQAVVSDVLEVWKIFFVEESKNKDNGGTETKTHVKADINITEAVNVEKVQKVNSITVEKVSRSETINLEKSDGNDMKMSRSQTVKVEKSNREGFIKVEKFPKQENLQAPKGPPKLTSMIKCNDSTRDKTREILVEAISRVS